MLIVPVMVAGWDIIMRTEAPESKLGHGRQISVLYSTFEIRTLLSLWELGIPF